MKISDITKTGSVLILRNSNRVLVLKDTANGDIKIGEGKWSPLDASYNDNLNCYVGSAYDIMKVVEPISNYDYSKWENTDRFRVLWEREPEKSENQLKKEEIQAKMDELAKELEELEVK